MDINVTSHNPLKMLGQHFMHIHKATKDNVAQGGIYNAVDDQYGRLGQIECVHLWKCHAYELKPAVLLLAEGNLTLEAYLTARKVGRNDMLQLCAFRYKRRDKDQFFKLCTKEFTKANMPYFQQQSMF